MALSVDKLLTDAHTLVVHLKDHDATADNILVSAQALFNKVEAMRQYQDDILELNEIAKHRPRSTLVLGLAQENRQIRELQQENRELQAALEEHQSALELIMQKYREHTIKLLQGNQMERVIQERDGLDKNSMFQLMDKIDEMAGVMQKAIEVDEKVGQADEERLSRLEIENRALREMLEICTTSQDRILPADAARDSDLDQSDSEDDKTDTDSSILVSPASLGGQEQRDGGDVLLYEVKDFSCMEIASDTTLHSQDSLPSLFSGKSPVTSKSTGDVRKNTSVAPGVGRSSDGAPSPTSVKKTVSNTLLKKDSGLVAKKSSSSDSKKQNKGKLLTLKK